MSFNKNCETSSPARFGRISAPGYGLTFSSTAQLSIMVLYTSEKKEWTSSFSTAGTSSRLSVLSTNLFLSLEF